MQESNITLKPVSAIDPERYLVLTGLYQIENLPSGEEVRVPVLFCPHANQSRFGSDDEVGEARLKRSPVTCPLCSTPHLLVDMTDALEMGLILDDGDDDMMVLKYQEVVTNSLRALRMAKSDAA